MRAGAGRTTTSVVRRSLAVAVVAGGITGMVALSPVVPARIAVAATPSVTNCDNSGPGSLRQAVQGSPSGAVITFARLHGCSRITVATTIDVDRSLVIDGPGAPGLAVSGNHAVEIFHVNAGVRATISGLTIEKGDAPDGGGIYNGGTLTVRNVVLSDNHAATGGGAIWNLHRLTVVTSTVADDSSGYFGGGVYSGPGGTLSLRHSTFSDDSVTDDGIDFPEYAYGGGVYAYGSAAIAGSTFTGDSAQAVGGGGGGGAIYCDGTVELTGTTVSGNRATIIVGTISADGGGGILNAGRLTVVDSNISHNSTNVSGGGIANGWNLKIVHSVVSGNTATTGDNIFDIGTP
jgi:hypothetical protein